jgi:hypothetical protein
MMTDVDWGFFVEYSRLSLLFFGDRWTKVFFPEFPSNRRTKVFFGFRSKQCRLRFFSDRIRWCFCGIERQGDDEFHQRVGQLLRCIKLFARFFISSNNWGGLYPGSCELSDATCRNSFPVIFHSLSLRSYFTASMMRPPVQGGFVTTGCPCSFFRNVSRLL